MTPLAARYFRATDNLPARKVLAQAQFFECSALYPLAEEMVRDDLAAGSTEYSEFAQLPAPLTVLEFIFGDARLMLMMAQNGSSIEYAAIGPIGDGNEQGIIFSCGFDLGTNRNHIGKWDEQALKIWSAAAGLGRDQFADKQATGTNGIAEKMLCMINQPGLVQRRGREIDRRILREIAKMPGAASLEPPVWHECRIRPGSHGDKSSTGSAAERQLHYVRKHFKPSVSKWIDGYWRGNADLGIHLKWYSAKPPNSDSRLTLNHNSVNFRAG